MDGWLRVSEVTQLENEIFSKNASKKVSTRTIQWRVKEGKYSRVREVKSTKGGQGGTEWQVHVSALPPDLQKRWVEMQKEEIPLELLHDLAPEAEMAVGRTALELLGVRGFGDDRRGIPDPSACPGLSMQVLNDPRVGKIARVVQEAQNPPAGWKRSKWIANVAMRTGMSRSQIYRNIKKYEKQGLAGLKHRKNLKNGNGGPSARSWSSPAIDFWMGLCLKKEHRKLEKKALYEALCVEAAQRGWTVGSYKSALWWFNKRVCPQLLALQRGGVRALDNTLPPILRDYSDLKPFEILVGDQRRDDRWVVDDETGEVLRPEGYIWQDLRTRTIYGGAVAKRYDAGLMGLALWVGFCRWGRFGSIYTDHGKPEESRYIAGIIKGMRALGMQAKWTEDLPVDLTEIEDDVWAAEELGCRIRMPGSHIFAIVRNAKAKMIERTNAAVNEIMLNVCKLPGHTKDIKDLQEHQEIDHKEIKALALAGKLPTFREYVIAFLSALDYYNVHKSHRGVIKEWRWKPRPREATPAHCLAMCARDGEWAPAEETELQARAREAGLVFLPRVRRVVDRGRIQFQNTFYEHDELIHRGGQRLDCCYDPLDPGWLMILEGGEYLCHAIPIEYSSMRNLDLAEEKIKEKARRRRMFLEEYRSLATAVPDLRNYSQIPIEDKAPALINRAKTQRAQRLEENEELYRVKSEEELAAEVARIESYESQDRRPVFANKTDRYAWILNCMVEGKEVAEQDRQFLEEFEAGMGRGQREYWNTYRDAVGLPVMAGTKDCPTGQEELG